MGTNNFYCKNARKYYAVLMDYDQPVYDINGDETNEYQVLPPQEYEVEDFINYVTEIAQESADKNEMTLYSECDKDFDELRSYPSTKLFQLFLKKSYEDATVHVNINCTMRSGYYEGANLDWYITYQVSGEILEDIDFFEAMQWHTNQSDAMLKKQCARAEKWAGKAKAKLIAIVEEVFTQVSTPYFKSAQFSNGEAVYTQY